MPTLSIAFGDSVSDINVLGEQLYIIVAAMFRQYSSLSEYTFYFRSLGAAVKDQSLLNLVWLRSISVLMRNSITLFKWKEIPSFKALNWTMASNLIGFRSGPRSTQKRLNVSWRRPNAELALWTFRSKFFQCYFDFQLEGNWCGGRQQTYGMCKIDINLG